MGETMKMFCGGLEREKINPKAYKDTRGGAWMDNPKAY